MFRAGKYPVYSKLIMVAIFPLTGFSIGHYLDLQETLRMTRFRDKSALYSPGVKEGDPPSWP